MDQVIDTTKDVVINHFHLSLFQAIDRSLQQRAVSEHRIPRKHAAVKTRQLIPLVFGTDAEAHSGDIVGGREATAAGAGARAAATEAELSRSATSAAAKGIGPER